MESMGTSSKVGSCHTGKSIYSWQSIRWCRMFHQPHCTYKMPNMMDAGHTQCTKW